MAILHENITEQIIAAAIEVHRHTGPGLLESVYAVCLDYELRQRGVKARREVALTIRYKDVEVDSALRLDLVVNDVVVVEKKSVEKLLPIHEAQLLTYLKLSKLEVGLLINFNVKLLRDGIVRRALSMNSDPVSHTPSSAFSAFSAVNTFSNSKDHAR